jgi:Fe-S-cluster-containing dehydrogenase component
MTRREFLELLTLSGLCLVTPGELVPRAAAKEPAKKWAMVVDTSKCGKDGECTDCIQACHRVHNVPNIPGVKRQVKWIWTTPFGELFPEADRYLGPGLRERNVLTLCNHCENPPCVSVCPTKATFQREDGIVMMDYHRCIGCRYCMAACPYGARSFNWQDPRPFIAAIDKDYPTRTRGVVEKCNFCEERLARGLAPACVEACKDGGLVFGDLNDPNSGVSKLLHSRYALQRKAELGTAPKVFYLV